VLIPAALDLAVEETWHPESVSGHTGKKESDIIGIENHEKSTKQTNLNRR
jgi:hypothetical protein